MLFCRVSFECLGGKVEKVIEDVALHRSVDLLKDGASLL